MWSEFKQFALKGNVVDLAVGVIIGAAFGKIVTSLVNDMIMPLLGLLVGGINFTDLHITVGSAVVKYGNFVQSVLDFVIVAFSIFVFIKLFSKLKRREEQEEEQEALKPSREEELLSEIRDLLKNRAIKEDNDKSLF
ncbi:large conductance mechanosensitive channel protein MscL [Risungbinella massiliensis]|uniref:large conductance mechanosensitive channel protein MscL n=1 Tax=Risungbinella massiliensis TaxID=1329796 RepID=UPI0005CC7D24|nr:large conductance mechanosensitive channel protein MscL [Risungbinella massiliensis]